MTNVNQDGEKKQGRFLKKGSSLLQKVSLSEFSFKEICEADVLTHDNMERNIIHQRYQDEERVARCVKNPDAFNDDLEPEKKKRPILQPRDFTMDWEHDKKMRKARAMSLQDEEIDFEFEEALAAQTQEKPSDMQEANADVSTATNTFDKDSADTVDTVNPNELPSDKFRSMNIVGQAIKDLNNQDDGNEALHVIKNEQPGSEDAQAPDHHDPQLEHTSSSPSDSAITPDEFIPTATAGEPIGMDPEAAAAEEYKKRVDQKASEEEKSRLYEDAKAKGYRDGFSIGEEQAQLQTKQHARELFNKFSDLINEFSNLKSEVLQNVQENFYEVCQALAEALLKREFSINPKAFQEVINKAIRDSVGKNEFKIKVHPDLFDKLMNLDDQELAKNLVRDQNIQPGDFKIESDLSVVDGQIHKLVEDLLKQADINLFDTEKAG